VLPGVAGKDEGLVLLWLPGDYLNRAAAQLAELAEQGPESGGLGARNGPDARSPLAPGGLDPTHRLFQGRPVAGDMSRLALNQEMFEDIPYARGQAALDQEAGEVHAPTRTPPARPRAPAKASGIPCLSSRRPISSARQSW